MEFIDLKRQQERLKETLFANIQEVLHHGRYILGPEVELLEQKLKDYVGVSHGVTCANGTDALVLALMALDIGPGDEVITTPFTFVATVEAIALRGATPVFVDIDVDTFNISPRALEKTLAQLQANNKKVKAILPVHTFGQMSDMEAISSLAQTYNIPIIEDAACAFGSRWNGRPSGFFSDLACYSFHPRKSLTTGEGGMLTTKDEALANKLRSLRNHGLDPLSSTPHFKMAGLNYRMTEFQAAIGRVQLKKMESILENKNLLAKKYDHIFEKTSFITPKTLPLAKHSYQSYVVMLPADYLSAGAEKQREFIARVRSAGVEVTIGTYCMPLTDFFKQKYKYAETDIPNAWDVYRRSISVPLYPGLTEDEQLQVVKTMEESL